MEDRQRVYIKGVPGRGDEVIKMFEDRGVKKNCFLACTDPDLIYYISHDGIIQSVSYNNELGKVIMDNYREIKLPEQWMDGDVLVGRGGDIFAVFRHMDIKSSFIAYMQASEDGAVDYENGVRCDREDYRLATDEEVERFYYLLHKHGKEWDDEAKILMDWKWKPVEGEDYFFLSNGLKAGKTSNDGFDIDVTRIRCGNCFRTMEEAEAMAGKIKKLLNGEAQ